MVDVVSAESPGVVPALIAHLSFYFCLCRENMMFWGKTCHFLDYFQDPDSVYSDSNVYEVFSVWFHNSSVEQA